MVTNNVHYMFSDHLGSTSLVTDALGTMAACNGYVSGQFESDYYPYGGEMPICNNVGDQNYKFTGKERDAETGLDYFTARFDTSSLGRFMSADPMLGHLGDPQSLNKYAYVENNPATLTDPTGLDPSFNSLASDMTPNTWGGQASEWCQQVKAFEGARALLEAMAQMGEAQAWNSALDAMWVAGGSSGGGSQQNQTPFNPTVTYEKNLTGNDLSAVQSKLGGAIGLVNTNWSKLSDQEKATMNNIKSVTVDDSKRTGIDVKTGTYNFKSSYIMNEQSTTAWLASTFGHDAYHVTQFQRGEVYNKQTAGRLEHEANQFMGRVGAKFGLTPSQLDYINNDTHTLYNTGPY